MFQVCDFGLHQIYHVHAVLNMRLKFHFFSTDTSSDFKGGEQCDGFRLSDPFYFGQFR